MSILAHYSSYPLVGSVRFTEDMLCVQLLDGREISTPLEWFPKLRDASDDKRNDWRLIGGGIGIHWKKLDEDLSVAGLLA